MLVAPGPMELVQAKVPSPRRVLSVATAGAKWTMACSFFDLQVREGERAAVFLKGLAEAGDVAVAEDAPHADRR